MNATDRVLQRCAVAAIHGRKNAKYPWTTPFGPEPYCDLNITACFSTRNPFTALPFRAQPSAEHVLDEIERQWEEMPIAELHQLDGVCDRFERALAQDSDTRIESFIVDLSESQQRLIVRELVPLEIELRQARLRHPMISRRDFRSGEKNYGRWRHSVSRISNEHASSTQKRTAGKRVSITPPQIHTSSGEVSGDDLRTLDTVLNFQPTGCWVNITCSLKSGEVAWGKCGTHTIQNSVATWRSRSSFARTLTTRIRTNDLCARPERSPLFDTIMS